VTDALTISYEDQPAWGVIGPAINEYNRSRAGDDNAQPLCFVLRSPDDEAILGGVIGATYWNWLQIDLMWVREDLRNRGYGRRLLELAEETARKRGATHSHLDTFSFQAPDFYRANGYELFGELTDYPRQHHRYYFSKEL
jgi:GNAT superfamily N-acetyltransferase